MNIEELKEELKQLEKKFLEFENQNERGLNWKPEFTEDYWVIDNDGSAYEDHWDNYSIDNNRLQSGNVYRTKEDVERILENRRTLVKLREFGFKPDWSDWGQDKCFDCMVKDELSWDFSCTVNCSPHVYYESEERQQEAWAAVGKDKIKQLLEYGVL